MTRIALGFVPEPRTVAIDQVLPTRKAPAGIASSKKYKQIKSSIAEVGLIEPLTVMTIVGSEGKYTLLDGHIRLLAMRELEIKEVTCLEATDDETYTYNNRLNRLSSIQEHHMLKRAIARGVPADRLARALSVDVTQVMKKVNLTDGLCPEVIQLLADRQFSAELARIVRKMKPTRQVECVELMVSANNLTVAYAEALLLTTPAEMLVDGKKPRALAGVSREQLARMEREMSNLQGQYRLVEHTYGQDVLALMLVRSYLVKLIGNQQVAKFLRQRVPEILEQFEAIAEATSLEG